MSSSSFKSYVFKNITANNTISPHKETDIAKTTTTAMTELVIRINVLQPTTVT